MIICLSKDYLPIAHVLGKLYTEPVITLLEQQTWTHPLVNHNGKKFIKRLTIIGHGESVYDDEQSMFGGNLSERVMMTPQFAHSLATLLKYNEKLRPGFCAQLKIIDILDFHKSEQTFKAKEIAEYLHADAYLREYASHLAIKSFANSNPNVGTRLMPHATNLIKLSFYAFESAQAFNQYRNTQKLYDELKTELHRIEQRPRATVTQAGMKSREETLSDLKKACGKLMAKGKRILREKTLHVPHIADPRTYLDKHPECTVLLSQTPRPVPTIAKQPKKTR